MGCPCSKEDSEDENSDSNEDENEPELEISSAQLIAPLPTNKEEVALEIPSRGGGWKLGSRRQAPKGGGNEGSVQQALKANLQVNEGFVYVSKEEGEIKTLIVERPKRAHHRKWLSMKMGISERQLEMSRIACLPHGAEGEQKVAGWPSWLTSVAGEAIKGWVPLRAESFEMLDKIGQGTYSSVYKAHDLETGKIVAMKKVRFVNMDPESVRFMAREISILRKLDHPNVMKLEGVVASRMSSSLFLVFEYMEHDLAGLASTLFIKFTESQIKCYMEQLLCGLQHCHSRGVLHRDMKCSNILVNNNGVLKIGDFGLATFYQPDQNQPLTSRVVTLWYRAPELLLGATDYGVAIDMWSTGCILAELFAGKPILPGRTEVEQMHKIFKLCGSPSEEYWEKTRLPYATSFKPQRRYKRCLAETFKDFPNSALALLDKLLAIEPEDRGSAASSLKTEFFTTEPLPCHPSSLPKYPPSKESDAKSRLEEERRKKADGAKGRGAEPVKRTAVNPNAVPTTDVPGQSNPNSYSHKSGGGDFSNERHRGAAKNSYSNIHPSVAQSSWVNKVGFGTYSVESRTLRSHDLQSAAGLSNSSVRMEERVSSKEATNKKNRAHYSGPLIQPGRNIDSMLKEHERQIQNAVRKARENRVK